MDERGTAIEKPPMIGLKQSKWITDNFNCESKYILFSTDQLIF